MVGDGTGLVRKQVRVADKRNAITAVPGLLRDHDLRGTITTMDGWLTQPAIVQHILDQDGHSLMIVEAHQSALYQRLRSSFSCRRHPL